jgi:hypothetical protein
LRAGASVPAEDERGTLTEEPSIRQQIANTEAEISELTYRLPRHSTPPAMLQRLEELEDDLAKLKSQLDETALACAT